MSISPTPAGAPRELLLRLIDRPAKPTIARVVIPALVRGDELITKNGCYGDLLRECRRLEAEGIALAAGIMIGNPFTDVPELCSQVLVMTDGDAAAAEREATRLAQEFWPLRFRMQGKLIALDRAIAQATIDRRPGHLHRRRRCHLVRRVGRQQRDHQGTARCRLPQARARADRRCAGRAPPRTQAGVGAQIEVALGGSIDPARFPPMTVTARVKLLSDGAARLETMKAPLEAGPTAVLTFDNFTVVVMSRSVSLFDRAMYFANGLDPTDFDLIVVKSPHTEHHMFDAWSEKNFNVDAPGATSANLKSLGHTICARPIYPLDENVTFAPRATIYRR